jgi:hypothetical protein
MYYDMRNRKFIIGGEDARWRRRRYEEGTYDE